MSKRHGAREQKRLTKQKAKREAKRRQLAVRSSPDPNIRLRAADGWPVVECLVPEELWKVGLGNLLIARRTPDGRVACAIFLVDVFCLGVKNALWKVVAPGQFAALRKDIAEHGRLLAVAPEEFAKLVYQAADYGQSLGFPPHRDFRGAQRLLAGIDPAQCRKEFAFGREGQPMYIRGPSESIDEARSIAARLHALGGHYIVPLEAPDLESPDVESPYLESSYLESQDWEALDDEGTDRRIEIDDPD